MNEFEIINSTDNKIDELDELRNVVEFALKYQKVENAIFNIIIVDEEEIHKINREYRGKDSVTDVISFALEDDKVFIETDFRVLGDIYVCIEKVRSQAEEYGHSFKRELAYLTIHGLLHLLGYDHMTSEEEKIMNEVEEMILNEYGIKR